MLTRCNEWPWMAISCQNGFPASTFWIRAFECQKTIQPVRFCVILCIAYQLANRGRYAQLTRCFSAVAELLVITLQCKLEELSDLYSAANMSVCVDANITGTFRNFLKFIVNYFNVYYKISTPVVFCPYTIVFTLQVCPVASLRQVLAGPMPCHRRNRTWRWDLPVIIIVMNKWELESFRNAV